MQSKYVPLKQNQSLIADMVKKMLKLAFFAFVKKGCQNIYETDNCCP